MIKAFGNDDTAMLVTLAFFTIYLICQLGGVAHGTGRHRADLLDSEAQTALKVSSVLYLIHRWTTDWMAVLALL